MLIDFMLKVFEENQENEAIVWNDKIYHYKWLLDRIHYWQDQIEKNEISRGTITIIEGDFSPNAIALFLALVNHGCILVPLTSTVESKKQEFIEIAEGEVIFSIDNSDNVEIKKRDHSAEHDFFKNLRKSDHPGLILFSSGSTGKSKAAVHDISGLLDKFKVRRHTLRSITFLLYDHIGGINTMLYILSNAGLIVTVNDRSPDAVLSAVEKYKVELLPTSPTFINLILISEAYKRFNLDSLQTVTYGTEPMPESTLKRFYKLFPDIKLLQTYGLSEVGILRSKSKSSDSLWVKVGGEDFNTRIVDGMLEIKAKSAMLGYLNAESPFTDDGWFKTGDSVEVDGEYIKILGRKSEIINVGGEKVYPQEVESVIQEIENVAEVTVYSENNPITGKMVCAKVRTVKDFCNDQKEDPSKSKNEKKDFIKKIKKHCTERLEKYKIPVKIKIEDKEQYSSRFKKVRK